MTFDASSLYIYLRIIIIIIMIKKLNCEARACNVKIGLGALYIIQAAYSHTETPKNEVGNDINKDYKQFKLQEAK